MSAPPWIAVDWGTSHLRAWWMADDATVLARAASEDGMSGLRPDAFEGALLGVIGGWLSTDRPTLVVACGMVGARQGWIEAPYLKVPTDPFAPSAMARPVARDPRLDVRIIPGLRQDRPADVMRGEETQIAGFLADHPGHSGLVCLPGTHTKWVTLRAGRVEAFQTCMTGEMFALLADHSVLRHSVGQGWDDAAFAAGVGEAYARPAAVAGCLFGLRAGALLHGLDPDAARARLSGLLIGAELASLAHPMAAAAVTVIGARGLSDAYVAALRQIGASPVLGDGDSATRAGLCAARARLAEETSA